ncbi:uncharacterized protein FIBRA_06809 [Fibroporia radiculosa]|uniref:Uncharacterized protein n=1 Tax=Fibroporia radiculosa TaxID=599839 RepID=J4GTK1_9APHY|nr:uncharacterized protein FIBRA_06809 [Fibroporia radiculosa]CCM04625.1 predicted protein [Fibroporia radiculosa]
MPSLQPYKGASRKLVIALDVGTTYSGIAYALLDPGEVPRIQGVTRFPGQENAAGDSKIPSILYYNQDGTVRAVGAEAALSHMSLNAVLEGWNYVEWFKLHLRPRALETRDDILKKLKPLPEGKTVVDVFADFLAYLYNCARKFITETHANGQRLWASLEDRIDFVLSHPNGWEGNQQTKMRSAAIQAGLIPDTKEDHGRIHFVTEGEASLHYCVQSGLVTEAVEQGHSVIVVDAGGGTVDLSTYKFEDMSPLSVEEVAVPDCIVQGSMSVNVRADRFLQDRLKSSPFGNEEDIQSMLENFEKSAKPIFKNAHEPSFIKFGSSSSSDPAVKIRRGQMTLAGSEVASFFQPSIEAIIDAVQKQRQEAPSSTPLRTVFLVGGFAASPWLFSQLNLSLQTLGLNLSRPDRHTNKAVAEGAISYYLNNWVAVRMTRLTYGIECSAHYDETDPEHYKRRAKVTTRPSGHLALSDHYSVILSKGTRVQQDQEMEESYVKEVEEPHALNRIFCEIMAYRGRSKKPQWMDTEPGKYYKYPGFPSY